MLARFSAHGAAQNASSVSPKKSNARQGLASRFSSSGAARGAAQSSPTKAKKRTRKKGQVGVGNSGSVASPKKLAPEASPKKKKQAHKKKIKIQKKPADARQEAKMALLLTEKACTWGFRYDNNSRTVCAMRDGDAPCCTGGGCHEKYSVSECQIVRAYYCSLVKTDRHYFVHDRHAYREAEGRTLKRRGHFKFESAATVAKKFGKVNHEYLMDADFFVDDGDAIRVCAKWFAWCLGVCKDTLRYNPKYKANIHTSPRLIPKWHLTVDFFDDCKERYEIMPAPVDDKSSKCFTVLPWRTHSLVHAAFVMEHERLHKTGRFAPGMDQYNQHTEADLGESDDSDSDSSPCDYEGCSAKACVEAKKCVCYDDATAEFKHDDEAEFDCPESSFTNVLRSDTEQERTTIKYRYGNKHLGAEAAGPLDKRIPGLRHFCRIWKDTDEYDHQVVVRTHMPFAKCAVCYKNRQETYHTRDEKKSALAREAQRLHLLAVARDRTVLDNVRQRARDNPNEVMCLAIDGADNGKNALPHFDEVTKGATSAKGANIHILGVLDEGRRPRVFVCTDNVKQGHNTSIQVHSPQIATAGRRASGSVGPLTWCRMGN